MRGSIHTDGGARRCGRRGDSDVEEGKQIEKNVIYHGDRMELDFPEAPGTCIRAGKRI